MPTSMTPSPETLSPSAHTDTFCRDNLPDPADWPEIVLGPDTSYPDRLNCATALLDDVIREHGGDRPCLLSPDGEEWSYEELRTTANRIANLLVEDLGLVPGNRVLLRGPNNPWTVACWFGVLKAGGVVVATMPLLRAGELAAVDEIARIDLSLCDHRFLDELQAAGTSAPVVAYGGSSADDLCQRIAEASTEHDDVVTAADDVALLAFTSGTTGRPKATMHFHRDVLAIADTFSRHVLQPTPEDRFTGTPPIAFTFGLGGAVVFPLRVGASTLLVEKATPAELAGHIETHGVTICFTAPTAYRAMVSGGHTGSLGSLRRAVSAGEHLDEATWRTFHEGTGIRIIDGIGSTEMLHVFIAAADDDIHPGSTGVEVPGYTARVVDEDGRTVPDGTPGRLAVKGPTGCRYLADPRQQVYVENGWNITGDTFVRDDEGYFWYRARNDDMIISSGYNIAGPEVEEAVLSHPDVSDCAVVGQADPSRGQLVVAYVVLRDGAQAGPELAAAIQDHVKSRIAPYKYPRRVEFIDALPRTATGKVQRYRLRDQTA
ncbi:AMP-binding protein [Janibacter terrae]|uniref:AMP-binding protein n=1 Tax=Janibacter terrae TaxID=103817 RepID=UPI000AD46199|nr:AMP-binding protein [Janibacter terrae]